MRSALNGIHVWERLRKSSDVVVCVGIKSAISASPSVVIRDASPYDDAAHARRAYFVFNMETIELARGVAVEVRACLPPFSTLCARRR